MSNQYASRISMLLMQQSMAGHAYFTGQTVDYSRFIWGSTVHALRVAGAPADTGVCGPDTRFCFLSESAKVFVLIEVSAESEAAPGAGPRLAAFLAELFARWRAAATSHVVSIILAARGAAGDRYRVVADWEACADWAPRLPAIAAAVHAFAAEAPGAAPSADGCFLEALNTVLNVFDRHHLDRDLARTGLSVVFLTAGPGAFATAGREALVEQTRLKALALGVWVQLVLLGAEPPHTVPRWGHDGSVPAWIDCSRYGSPGGGGAPPPPAPSAAWDLYPPHAYEPAADPAAGPAFGWQSLVTPPCLPLRTGAALPAGRAATATHRVFPDSTSPFLQLAGRASEFAAATHVAQEMVLLRLAQGWQLAPAAPGAPVVLARGDDFQTIECSPRASHITVTAYAAPAKAPAPVAYRYELQAGGGRHQRAIRFEPLAPIAWPQLDGLLCGRIPNVDALPVWCTRFILIPAGPTPRASVLDPAAAPGPGPPEAFTDDDLRIAAFCRFMHALTAPAGPAGPASLLERLGIHLTTTRLTTYLAQEAPSERLLGHARQHSLVATADGVQVGEQLSRASPLADVAALMQNPLVGMAIRRRRWFATLHDPCFVGAEAVDWVLKFFEDMATRPQAVAYCQALLRQGVWEHVAREHDFIDGHFFYRFAPRHRLDGPPPAGPPARRTVELSRRTLVPLGAFPDRKEWAMLHYDTVHNPKIAFHFTVRWLNCSSRLLDTRIRAWAGRARRLGFALVEVPATPPGEFGPTPFDAAVSVPLAAQPPRAAFLAGYAGTLLIEEMLVRHGFVLDLEPDAHFPPNEAATAYSRSAARPPVPHLQYIHATGAALVQVAGADGARRLLWSRNKLHAASTRAGQERDASLADLQALCSSPDTLQAYWSSLLHEITLNPAAIASLH